MKTNKETNMYNPKSGAIISVYLNVFELISSLVNIPTISNPSITSLYTYGCSPLYRSKNDKQFGVFTASFMCSKQKDVYANITNHLSLNNGLIVSWSMPIRLHNLELESIIHSMVTECIVISNVKNDVNPFYGKKFNLIVRSVVNKENNTDRIYFDFVPYKINFSVM